MSGFLVRGWGSLDRERIGTPRWSRAPEQSPFTRTIPSIAVAHAKAYTARAFDMPTAELQSMVQPDEPLYGIESSDPGRIAAFPGGIPLKVGEQIVGAIGVSGGLVDQDQQVAEAGAAALSS